MHIFSIKSDSCTSKRLTAYTRIYADSYLVTTNNMDMQVIVQ